MAPDRDCIFKLHQVGPTGWSIVHFWHTNVSSQCSCAPVLSTLVSEAAVLGSRHCGVQHNGAYQPLFGSSYRHLAKRPICWACWFIRQGLLSSCTSPAICHGEIGLQVINRVVPLNLINTENSSREVFKITARRGECCAYLTLQAFTPSTYLSSLHTDFRTFALHFYPPV